MNILSNALWISGGAFGLAVLSYVCWEAGAVDKSLRQLLSRQQVQRTLAAAGLLTSLGAGASAADPLLSAVFILLGLVFLGIISRSLWNPSMAA